MMMKLGLNVSTVLSALCTLCSLSASLMAGNLAMNSMAWVVSWDLSSKTVCKMELSVLVDSMSLGFSAVVLFIARSVVLFSKSYMVGERFFLRFHLLLLFFVISMVSLIFGVSMFTVILGWDGLGVTSYLLVIYYASSKSANAGMLTALMNRVGDVFVMLAIAFTLMEGGYNFNVSGIHASSLSPVLAGLLILASLTKSAQVPFSSWLPAAMAAPTPVSALVHSSTLVTAGVYLMIRFEVPLSVSLLNVSGLLAIGSATMIMAGVAAMVEVDMKKIVALSTLSQLGLMMTAIGLQQPSTAFFHLVTHAFTKALLFMGVGNLIHSANEYQDLRHSTLALKTLPVCGSILVCTNLSLAGSPFFAGFYSKDMWLESTLLIESSVLIYVGFLVGVAITCVYSIRVVFFLLVRDSQSPPLGLESEESLDFKGAVVPLWVSSLIAGSVVGWAAFSSPGFLFIPVEVKTLTLKLITFTTVSYCAVIYNLESGLKVKASWVAKNMWGLPMISAHLPLAVSLMSIYSACRFMEKASMTHYSITLEGLYTSKLKGLTVQGDFNTKYGQLLVIASALLTLNLI